ncbi:MAG: hypothetical protein HY579_03370 [Nitrospinae bacterium]|nr:hypothetical protein [Nitrospinota bacterium]
MTTINLVRKAKPMDSSETAQNKAYEQLNGAILKAITASEEVKQVLLDFQKKNLIDRMAVLNLILSLEELEALTAADNPCRK